MRAVLFAGSEVKGDGDGEEDKVRQPRRHERGHDVIDGEGGADGREKDIQGSEANAYPEVLSHASAHFAAGHRDAEQGHDKRPEGRSPALVVLHFKGLDVA